MSERIWKQVAKRVAKRKKSSPPNKSLKKSKRKSKRKPYKQMRNRPMRNDPSWPKKMTRKVHRPKVVPICWPEKFTTPFFYFFLFFWFSDPPPPNVRCAVRIGARLIILRCRSARGQQVKVRPGSRSRSLYAGSRPIRASKERFARWFAQEPWWWRMSKFFKANGWRMLSSRRERCEMHGS